MRLFLLDDVQATANAKLKIAPPATALEMYLDDHNSIHMRPISVMGDFQQETSAGPSTHRAFLTHLGDSTCRFTSEEIAELEFLIEDSAPENELQKFFEDHPKWFGMWNMSEVHEHVCLYKGESRRDSLIPDFILTDPDLYRAVLLDLKLPNQSRPLIRRTQNREGFGDAVSRARQQLLRYRDWFRIPENRAKLSKQVGMEIYEPHMAVLIGRSREFLGAHDRQRLSDDIRPVEVTTYDDLLTFARRRRIVIEGIS